MSHTRTNSNPALKTISERYSGEGLLLSTLPSNTLLNCPLCKEKYDNDHYPLVVCKNNHMACRKCLQQQFSPKPDLKSSKIEKGCPQCQQKITKQSIWAFQPYFQLCQYIRKLQQISKKQQMRYQLKQTQAEQANKMLKNENIELKRWIKDVSEKLREMEIGKKWNTTKTSEFVFELPAEVKNSQYLINEGVVKKACVGSFTNVVGLQPIPKHGVHSFGIKLITSLSGGSILYGLCASQAKQQRFPWLTQYFIGYSGNDGDVISAGSWSNASTLYYDGKKVRAGDQITTIVDMNSKIISWGINSQFMTESYVIPHHLRNKLLFPMVVIQDGDQIQIINESHTAKPK